ncbi:MAG TPA: phenylalanine--tRNA ligase subunit beta, partial [Gemmatimonadaceae bacterium]|nr:phenylalanine--tRNA ligase subunit beta [Gemmatimonadaceae bacterium]
MNISYNWLKDFVDTELTPAAVADVITSRAATVDAVEALREDLAQFVIARVVECAPHPDSDHLSVTKVDAGTGELLDVVCGAPNVRAGKLYPFAKTGTRMPAGFTIERRKIRGAVSNGMLCSAREIGLGEEQDGILELDIDVPPGTSLLAAMPSVSDARIVVDVLANRPDLLSHLGVAREVAAALGKSVSLARAAGGGTGVPLSSVAIASGPTQGTTGDIAVSIDDVDGCPRYLGVVIRGVHVGPSPDWLVQRLAGAGTRAINNIVDVTNFMLIGFGQPMHAFDAKRLGGQAIVVRRAHKGEKLVTLDGVERQLTEDMCVIADGERPHALAGVMGGRDSEVTADTTDVLLEVAAFNPRRVRQMRRALSISSEAAYRFERGTDVVSAPERLKQAVALITALAGGVAESAVDVYPAPATPTTLNVRVSRVKQVLGEPIAANRIAQLLRSIGFAADVRPGTEMLVANEELVVSAPSWRGDIVAEIDVIEEVARLHGYDAFSDRLRPFRVGNVPDSPEFALIAQLQDALAADGLYEVRPLPFVAGNDATHPRVANPLAENEAHLRTSILESLASRAELNLSHMEGNVRLFEVGAVFSVRAGSSLPLERRAVGALVMGDRRPPHFTEPKPPRYDMWDAKALAERIASVAAPAAAVSLVPAHGPSQQTGTLWTIQLDGVDRGVIRAVSLDAPVWAAPAFGVELDLGLVDSTNVAEPGKAIHGQTPPAPPRSHVQFKALPSTPAAQIDLALIVPETLQSADVERVIRNNGGDLLERLTLFDEFRGQGLPAGTRSL